MAAQRLTLETASWWRATITYNRNGLSYYGATYRFTTADHTCEGEIELTSISEDTFEDNGHAIVWTMNA
jgi:hypothetical protein